MCYVLRCTYDVRLLLHIRDIDGCIDGNSGGAFHGSTIRLPFVPVPRGLPPILRNCFFRFQIHRTRRHMTWKGNWEWRCAPFYSRNDQRKCRLSTRISVTFRYLDGKERLGRVSFWDDIRQSWKNARSLGRVNIFLSNENTQATTHCMHQVKMHSAW